MAALTLKGLHQVAVHHHQGLRNRAIEGGGFVPLVGAKGDCELAHPHCAVAFLFRSRARHIVGLGRDDKRLIKFFGPHLAQVEAAELVALVANSLARYKQPSEIVFVEEIPRLPSGKVLRRELRDEKT